MLQNQVAIVISFLAFLLLFTGVGIYSATRKQNNTADYLLASRNVNPWLTALSAFATNYSGFMFIGLIGWTYQVGISTFWPMLITLLGQYIAWLFVHKQLRVVSEETGSETIGSFLGQGGERPIVVLSALITIVFVGAYAAAQLLAGGKALFAIFGWDYAFGIVVGAVIVTVYCFAGGIRASIWTDAVQSILMMFAMLLLVALGVQASGGLDGLWTQLREVDPKLLDPTPNAKFGFLPFVISWLFQGLGVVGQPHIMIRAMVINSPEKIGLTRNIYTLLAFVFTLTAIGVALTARILIPDLADIDPELALPQLAIKMLPAVWVGVILAGIFSAVISTADSQILSCSAALTQDLFPQIAHSYKLVKLGTVLVTAITMVLALANNQSVFASVLAGWSALGSGLGPLLVVRAWRQPVSVPVAVAMMATGVAVSLIWRFGLNLSSDILEIFPGMVASTLVYLVASKVKL
ncbi:MAG: sodium/proline symporter [Moorea sp. SIO1G6]|uniref:Sodium/proline symporter n=1 Tax=Moorena producens (strain JHB) TaxID=1454205 RepID=A0A1D9G9I8_MOOP1|nr:MULTISPECIES: sodium/proline symporter [Moorena]AOY84302.1 sodium/proline symporter [Moorena producens JHB]NES80847.1 sodium/proline symporter [Moorena sp. SIO2B7]NET66958.1 sodium/proline symporter [Moorena sp. SIO1G6]